jgi:tetratricopeptide (TPR) repeat protein
VPGFCLCYRNMMQPGQLDTSHSATTTSLEARVWESLGQNRIKQAIAQCEQLTGQYPRYASGWHTASHLAVKLNNPVLALKAIENALQIEPDNTPWLLQKALCLARLGRIEELGLLVKRLQVRKMGTAYQCASLAMLLTQLGRREQAVQLYEQAAVLKPEVAKHYYNIACLRRSLGDVDTAELNFDRAISLNTTDYESYKIRSDLRRQTPENNHVESLESLLMSGLDDQRGKVQICYALAKELEDLGEAERSFHFLKTGADLRRSLMQYDARRDLDTISSIRTNYTPELFDGCITGDQNAEAIFVLGLPRTGTTLVERILSSHSEVFAAGELTHFSVQMMKSVKAQNNGQSISRDDLVRLTTRLDFKKLGAAYLESTRPLTGHTARFIDKLPLNYLYIGLIHLALPKAKIVLLQRHPLDTCYAIYKQLFVDAYPFSYCLEELARYYVAYHQLIEHWQQMLPGVIHTLDYETLVNDFESESQKLLEYCGLDWQEQCLKFYENKAASTTASTVQIRQPVYQSSVGKWRQYREQLQPAIKIFNEAGISL